MFLNKIRKAEEDGVANILPKLKEMELKRQEQVKYKQELAKEFQSRNDSMKKFQDYINRCIEKNTKEFKLLIREMIDDIEEVAKKGPIYDENNFSTKPYYKIELIHNIVCDSRWTEQKDEYYEREMFNFEGGTAFVIPSFTKVCKEKIHPSARLKIVRDISGFSNLMLEWDYEVKLD